MQEHMHINQPSNDILVSQHKNLKSIHKGTFKGTKISSSIVVVEPPTRENIYYLQKLKIYLKGK